MNRQRDAEIGRQCDQISNEAAKRRLKAGAATPTTEQLPEKKWRKELEEPFEPDRSHDRAG